MRLFNVNTILLAAGTAHFANAHTALTNFFIDGVNQGDGVAVRMSDDPPKATFPIKGVTSPDMACGKSFTHMRSSIMPRNAHQYGPLKII